MPLSTSSLSTSSLSISNDFTLLYNPSWGYNRCSTKAYFKSSPNPTTFQHGYYGVENSTIRGSFHLIYPVDSPLYTNKIELIFEGKQFVSWKENNNIITDERIIHKQSSIIWKSTNNHYEEISTLVLPFEFHLPDNLPTTITSLNVKSCGGKIAGGIAGDGTEIGYITYNLRAEISRPINIFKLQINQKKIVDVWCRIQKWQNLENLNDEPFIWQDSNDDIRYEVKLEKTLFNYKDMINIPMKFFINDSSEVKIKKICVRIKEFHELKINDKSKKIKIGGFVVVDTALGEQAKKLKSDDDDYYYFNMKLNLTKTNLGRKLNCSINNEMINIRHKLKIKIFLENSNLSSIDLEKEITILNFITKQETLEQNLLTNTNFVTKQETSELNLSTNTWFYHNEIKPEEIIVKKQKNVQNFLFPCW
jgi:hypothetical protein